MVKYGAILADCCTARNKYSTKAMREAYAFRILENRSKDGNETVILVTDLFVFSEYVSSFDLKNYATGGYYLGTSLYEAALLDGRPLLVGFCWRCS